MAGSISI